MKNRSLRAALAAGSIAMLLLAGCGDDGDEGSGGGGLASMATVPSTTSTTEAEADDDAGSLFDEDEAGSPGDGLFDGGDDPGDTDDTGDPDVDVIDFFGSDVIDAGLASALHEACTLGDMQACDTIYLDSPAGTEAEAFGAECGGALPEADRFCVQLDSAQTGSYVPLGAAFDGAAATEQEQLVVDECGRGGMNACDALLLLAEQGSDAWNFGATCGGRSEAQDLCTDQFGLGAERASEWMEQNGLA